MPASLGPSFEQRKREAVRRTLARIEKARTDVNAYIEYTTRVPPKDFDSGQGERWARQDPVHVEWQAIWSKHRRAVILGPVGTAKSTQLRKRLEHEIGRNHNILISYISGSELLPKKQLAAMQEEIERNPRVKHVYPTLKRSRGDGKREAWSAKALLVDRTLVMPDPTVQVFGFLGKIIGSRSDIIVLDDIINFENSLTEAGRDKVFDWLAEVISRVKPGAKVWAIGHIWNEQDALQRLARKPQWHYSRHECFVVDKEKVRENAEIDDDDASELDTQALTPDEIRERAANGEIRTLAPRIQDVEDVLEKIEDLTPAFASMMLWNRLPHGVASRFRQQWFDRCLALGRGLATSDNPTGFLDTWHGGQGLTYTGVDLGHRRKPGSDRTALFTGAVLPDGTRQIIDVRSGLWKGPEILREIQDVHARFGSIISVENNAAQNYLLEFAEDLTCLPVRPHTTGSVNKHDIAHGVESLGIELAQGKWMIPCSDDMIPCEEIGECIKGCFKYDPTRHTSDWLMAWWICREAIRLSPAAASYEPQPLDLFTRV